MQCKQCGCDKGADAFYASNKSRCKECIKSSVRANRLDKIDYYQQYDRMRGSMPHRVAARKDYAKTPEGKRAHARALKVSAARFPDRAKARIQFGNAVRDGCVIPWPVCAVPECCGKPHGHHPDYSRPLDVVWLCDKHHKEAHALVKRVA